MLCCREPGNSQCSILGPNLLLKTPNLGRKVSLLRWQSLKNNAFVISVLKFLDIQKHYSSCNCTFQECEAKEYPSSPSDSSVRSHHFRSPSVFCKMPSSSSQYTGSLKEGLGLWDVGQGVLIFHSLFHPSVLGLVTRLKHNHCPSSWAQERVG